MEEIREKFLKGIGHRELIAEGCNKTQEQFETNVGLMRILKTEGRGVVFIGTITRLRDTQNDEK